MAIPQESPLFKRVQDALKEVRPHLLADGGDVEIVELTEDMILKVRYKGACSTCSMSEMTLRAGIQEAVKNRVPEVLNVIAIS